MSKKSGNKTLLMFMCIFVIVGLVSILPLQCEDAPESINFASLPSYVDPIPKARRVCKLGGIKVYDKNVVVAYSSAKIFHSNLVKLIFLK